MIWWSSMGGLPEDDEGRGSSTARRFLSSVAA